MKKIILMLMLCCLASKMQAMERHDVVSMSSSVKVDGVWSEWAEPVFTTGLVASVTETMVSINTATPQLYTIIKDSFEYNHDSNYVYKTWNVIDINGLIASMSTIYKNSRLIYIYLEYGDARIIYQVR